MRRGAAVLLSAVLLGVGSPQAVGREPDLACAVPVPGPVDEAGTGIAAGTGIDRVHRIATGAGVRVAVVDTGVAEHPQFTGLVAGGDLVSPAAPDPLRDCDGHGTVVAGVIAARDGGIAPDATLISIRQTSAHYRSDLDNDATAGTLAGLSEAIHLALDAEADVINVSVVSCIRADLADTLDTTELDAALARAEHERTVIVAAAGNIGHDCHPGAVVHPAHAPTVLAVSAVHPTDPHGLADYALPAATDRPLAAPGVVPAGVSPGGHGWATGLAGRAPGEVIAFEGTSFAAPVVSGTVALLRQRYPDETAAQLRERVWGAAEPGHGVVDPHAALTHLAAEFTVEARGLAVAAGESEEEPPWRRFRRVLATAGVLVLAGLVCAGAVRPRG